MPKYTHPRDLIVQILHRLYNYGMTTTSGGNLSIRDNAGDIWITPRGTDKATIHPEDVVRVNATGELIGRHQPSCELPFHRAIYSARSDVNAILHAHSPALTAFALVEQCPRVELVAGAKNTCGNVATVGYASPGSPELGKLLAGKFEQGTDVVIMANHGTVAVGADLAQAFTRLEALEFVAKIQINALMLGTPNPSLRSSTHAELAEFIPDDCSPLECEIRADMTAFCARSYQQYLIFSGHSFFAARLHDDDFLITPAGYDPLNIAVSELVRICNGKRETGKQPTRSVRLFREIFRYHKEIGAVAVARPPYATAFSLTKTSLNSKIVPESYMALRNIPLLPHSTLMDRPQEIIEQIGLTKPVIMVENYGVLTVGWNLSEVFDHLETTEFTARALLYAQRLGKPRALSDAQLKQLIIDFNLTE